ncbi:hypothetical protein B0O80DRAFT_502217 [Mortierella sp. GBAus27b]|nr:hypothetical protein B0O80DRAFT_502217 [Mortierella sp. GBAus27b]
MSVCPRHNSPFEIPEIRTSIGRLLAFTDLIRCMQVCRAWHTSFLPFIWSTVSLRNTDARPSVEALGGHNELVKDLVYNDGIWRLYNSIHFHNLTSLTIIGYRSRSPVTIPHYDHLRSLTLFGNVFGPSRCSVWKLAHSLQTLTNLSLNTIDIDPTDNAAFWDLCTRLDTLRLWNAGIAELPDNSITFERLHKLGLSLRVNFSLDRQLDWISRCPNLVTLDWCPQENTTSGLMDNLVMRADEITWPDLSELHLREFYPSDQQLARMIRSMRRLTTLDLLGCEFGPLSLEALSSHFAHLQELNIGGSSIPVGPVIPTVMVSCPQLSVLAVGDFMSQDIIDSQAWVCRDSMKSLLACFRITPNQDEDSHQQRVFERIAQLSNLERLSLVNDYSGSNASLLQLQLGKGLEQLSTLKKLRSLALLDFTLSLSVDDVKWMIDNWKSLESVQGILDPLNNNALASMLQAAGIRYER